MKIKKGDNVLIITGKDRGKRAIVEKVLPKAGKLIVTGINIAKHHLKPSRKNPHGGIINKLAPIDVSNVMVICPRCSNPTKIGEKVLDKKKMRICKKCKESLDTQ